MSPEDNSTMSKEFQFGPIFGIPPQESQKLRSSGLTLNCRKACLISAISPIALVRNLKRSGEIFSERLGPALKHSFREEYPGCLKDASKTGRTLVVRFFDDLITGL
ncbi:hypothetical protein CEXT_104061 [Caerostris extrusa]|uniref:Uncharacterized protein n=1 Tax=Caerostris extrusa TaxID=172846 RepID=A0AAV4N9D3_CAEEX|nr:hypothetical protein CEXT_104061 [Caerostris extrusa]